MLLLPSTSKAGVAGAAQPRLGTRPIRGQQALHARSFHSIRNSGIGVTDFCNRRHGHVSAAAASKQASSSAQVAIDSPTSLRAFMQALQGKADSLRALAASFAPQAAAADAETLEKVQHAVKRLKAFVSIGHSLSESYVRRLGRSVNDTTALRALASHIVRIDVLASSVTAMKRSFECGGIEMGEQLSSLLESVRALRATATQAEQEAQYLQDNPEAAAKALQQDAENDAAAAQALQQDTEDSNGASTSNNGSSNGSAASAAPHAQGTPEDTGALSSNESAAEDDELSSETEGQMEDSDSSVGVYEETTEEEEEEDLESVEGLHNSIQRQRSRLQALMTRVESLQHLAANLENQEEGKGEQNVETLRNAVVELAKLRQMVESDDAALESHDAALGAASVRAATGQQVPMPDAAPAPPMSAPQTSAPAEGATVRKVPGLDSVGAGAPHVQRRRSTVDMYESRHLRKQEENERPRHQEEVSKISERIMHESEALRQQLREREADMEGRPPPRPRTREEVWEAARRRRPTGDYTSRRTSEGWAREKAGANRRRSSASRLAPPIASDTPVGSDWSRRAQSTQQAASGEPEQRGSEKAWEMFASGDAGRDGRSQDKSGQPFVRMRRRSSYESRRSGSTGDEENQRRRRGSVDFSVRGNKASAPSTDWTSTDWSDTSTPGSSAARSEGSADGLWGAAKRLFGGGAGGDEASSTSSSASSRKPFVRPKKSRPQHSSTERSSGSNEENVRRRVVPPSPSSASTADGFWGGSGAAPAQEQGRGDSSYTRIGSSSTPYVHKRKSVDYAARYGSGRDHASDSASESEPEQDWAAAKQPEHDTPATAANSGGFWGSSTAATAAEEAGQVLRNSDQLMDVQRDYPQRTESRSSAQGSGFWGSETAAAAAAEAGEVLRRTSRSEPGSQPYVHRRRATSQSYSARRSSTGGAQDGERQRRVSDTKRRNASRTAYSAFSEASDYLASSAADGGEPRKAPLVRKKLPDYSARRGGGGGDSGAVQRRTSQHAQQRARSQADMRSSSGDYAHENHGGASADGAADETTKADIEAQSSFFGSVNSLRDAIARRSRSASRNRPPSRRKSQDSFGSAARGAEPDPHQRDSTPPTTSATHGVASGGTDWSSDSWSEPQASAPASGSYQYDAGPSEPTPNPSAAVRRRRVVDYAARRLSVQGREDRRASSSAAKPPQSYRVDSSAYEDQERRAGAGLEDGFASRDTGEVRRGAARYAQGDAFSNGSYNSRRSSAQRRSSFSRNGSDGDQRSGAGDPYGRAPDAYGGQSSNGASAARGESSSNWGLDYSGGEHKSTDWGSSSSRAVESSERNGKPFVRGKPSYAARRGGGDEENARRGRRRSMDAH